MKKICLAVLPALTIVLELLPLGAVCIFATYKKGKMSLRNFKIVSICESLAILGMIFLIICLYSNMKL